MRPPGPGVTVPRWSDTVRPGIPTGRGGRQCHGAAARGAGKCSLKPLLRRPPPGDESSDPRGKSRSRLSHGPLRRARSQPGSDSAWPARGTRANPEPARTTDRLQSLPAPRTGRRRRGAGDRRPRRARRTVTAAVTVGQIQASDPDSESSSRRPPPCTFRGHALSRTLSPYNF